MAKRYPHPAHAHTSDDERFLRSELLDTPDVVETEEIDTGEELSAPPPVATPAERRQLQIRRVRKGIFFVVHIIAVFFGIRIALALFGANPDNVFVNFMQVVTAPFAAPFANLFGMLSETGGFVSALGLLFGIAVYYLFAWIIAGIATSLMSRPIKTVDETHPHRAE